MYLAAFKKFIVLLAALGLLVFENSCKSSGTGPEDNVPAGRRDYVWTVDTLNTPLTYLIRFWGTSPKNLWVAGPGTYEEYNMWNYDGKKWKQGTLKEFGRFSPRAIWGFSENNIWMAGENGLVLNREGNKWTESLRFSSAGYSIVIFSGLYGESPNDMYAVGTYDSLVNKKDNCHGLMFH